MTAKMSFQDIPRFVKTNWWVNVPWRDVLSQVQRWQEKEGLDLNPPYQRAHVWTQQQQIAYVEYCLQGGEVGRKIIFNSPDWMNCGGSLTIVDGKQRLHAVMEFMQDRLPVFGATLSHWSGSIREDFIFGVVELKTDEDLYQLYLNINAGGTPHTEEEINKVRKMLADLRGK